MGARGRHQSVESALVEYRPQETARLVADPILQHNIGRYSIRAVANAAGSPPTPSGGSAQSDDAKETTTAARSIVRRSLADHAGRQAGYMNGIHEVTRLEIGRLRTLRDLPSTARR